MTVTNISVAEVEADLSPSGLHSEQETAEGSHAKTRRGKGADAKAGLKQMRSHLENVASGLITEIPKKAEKATLKDVVSALAQLVPLLKDLYALTSPQKQSDDATKIIRDLAKKKLAQKSRSNGKNETDS